MFEKYLYCPSTRKSLVFNVLSNRDKRGVKRNSKSGDETEGEGVNIDKKKVI